MTSDMDPKANTVDSKAFRCFKCNVWFRVVVCVFR